MKKGFVAVIIVLIIFLILFTGMMLISNSGIDIHFHDTYFVFSYRSFIIPFLLIFAFVFSLTAAISTKFRNRLYSWLLVLSVGGIIFYCFHFYSQYKKIEKTLNKPRSYINTIKSYAKEVINTAHLNNENSLQ